jgi:Domain of unknown function (DUF4276)
VQKAIVVSDAHGRDPGRVIEDLRIEMQGQAFAFPVAFAVVVQELEAWLLADHEAVQHVCTERGTGRVVPPTKRSPELFTDAKTELQKLLVKHRVIYTTVVAEDIAQNARLEQLRYWCQSFRAFEPVALDC